MDHKISRLFGEEAGATTRMGDEDYQKRAEREDHRTRKLRGMRG